MLDENKIFNENAAEIFFIQKKLLLAINADFCLGLKFENNAIVEEVENEVAKNGKLNFHMN